MAVMHTCSASHRAPSRLRARRGLAETRLRLPTLPPDPYGSPGSALEAERAELLEAILESLGGAASAQLLPVHRRLLAHLACPQRISFPRESALQ
ncbi:MAG: hypothetical protein K6T61_13470 [Bryobacteraceae bacterium]|nr:hypothetical protein [Bryobacteraceae bacterium]